MLLSSNSDSIEVHASCVAKDGAAILFIGPAGSGKSTRCYHLITQGYALVADDIVHIDHDNICSSGAKTKGLMHLRDKGFLQIRAAQICTSAKLSKIICLDKNHKAVTIDIATFRQQLKDQND
jgi:HPr kinase/phosphorylase